jgi:putative membrane protein
MVLTVLKFTAALLILRYMPLRLALTPAGDQGSAGAPQGHRDLQGCSRAADRRRTGILIYLSMGEHRAEIVADEAITKVTTPGMHGARRWPRFWSR